MKNTNYVDKIYTKKLKPPQLWHLDQVLPDPRKARKSELFQVGKFLVQQRTNISN